MENVIRRKHKDRKISILDGDIEKALQVMGFSDILVPRRYIVSIFISLSLYLYSGFISTDTYAYKKFSTQV